MENLKSRNGITMPLKDYLKLLAFRLKDVGLYPDSEEQMMLHAKKLLEDKRLLELIKASRASDEQQSMKKAS